MCRGSTPIDESAITSPTSLQENIAETRPGARVEGYFSLAAKLCHFCFENRINHNKLNLFDHYSRMHATTSSAAHAALLLLPSRLLASLPTPHHHRRRIRGDARGGARLVIPPPLHTTALPPPRLVEPRRWRARSVSGARRAAPLRGICRLEPFQPRVGDRARGHASGRSQARVRALGEKERNGRGGEEARCRGGEEERRRGDGGLGGICTVNSTLKHCHTRTCTAIPLLTSPP